MKCNWNDLCQRNDLTEEEAKSRISSQLPMEVKEEGADAVIFNNGTIEEAEKQLDTILNSWKVKV